MADELSAVSTASPSSPWTHTYMKAVICLVMGLAVGYLLRGPRLTVSPAPPASNTALPSTTAVAMASREMPAAGQVKQVAHASVPGGGHMPSSEEMKQMADTQAAPLLDKLKSDPKNSALLCQVGAIYHTTHQFKQAAVYYEKAAQVEPGSVAIRTKLASSLYRSGDVDGAIAQLNQGLKYDPKDANSLFDLGMIRLHGKQDTKGALSAWQQLLKSNPQLSADRKATVQKLMAAVLTMLSDQNGIQGAQGNDGHKPNFN